MIAAGEVVERPSSVVKELCENSIDAGAKSVTVEIKKGGVPYIRITDNGSGIDADDIETAFRRHATSKIKDARDLDAIGTLGFRGEALASIAAVSRMEVFSKTKDRDIGRCVTVEAGEVLENDDAGCPDGTTMIVRNLFFNTPARMKFLKNDATETAYITDVINKLTLSHPEVAFHYINNGKTVLKSSGDGKLISAIYTVLGRDYAKNMTEVCYEEDGIKVTGFVGNSSISRKDRRHQIFFVNSRNIMSRVISTAVGEAYKNTLMTGRFPVCVLKTELDAHLLDVNVHPAKIEVRFSDDKKIYHTVYWAVKNALTDKKYVPEIALKPKPTGESIKMPVKNAPSYDDVKQIDFLKDSYVETPKKTPTVSIPKTVQPPVYTKAEKPIVPTGEETDTSRFDHTPSEPLGLKKEIVKEETVKQEIVIEEEKPQPKEYRADIDFRLAGQVFGTFILLEIDNDMIVIDQHAAHERICYEELLEEFSSNEDSVNSQLMLLPVTMTLTPSEMALAEEYSEVLCKLGFETESFGSGSIIVRSTPDMMEEQDIKDLVSDIITLIGKNQNNIKTELFREALHMIACKKALKGNKSLSEKEMKALSERVLSLGDGINTCPHGRPIMVKMSKYSMEKQFKRVL